MTTCRGRILIWIEGLVIGLLSGCLHASKSPQVAYADAAQSPGQVSVGGGQEKSDQSSVAQSPYHPQVLPAANSTVVPESPTVTAPAESPQEDNRWPAVARVSVASPMGLAKAGYAPESEMGQPKPVAPANVLAHPKSADTPLMEALRCYLENRPEEAINIIHIYDKETQEMLLALLPVVAHLSETKINRASPEEADALLRPLNQVCSALQARTALSINKICLCRKIDGYGSYEPLPENYAFEAGSGDHPGELVQVYVDLRNFNSQMRGDRYETWMAGRVEIRDFHGKVHYRTEFEPEIDSSRSPRHDYFINYRFYVPRGLPPGSYTLWVQVMDMTGQEAQRNSGPRSHISAQRIARRSLDFRVTAPGTGSSSPLRGDAFQGASGF